jgi:hypothetical protein
MVTDSSFLSSVVIYLFFLTFWLHSWFGVFVNTRGFDRISIDTSDVVYQIIILNGFLDCHVS